MFRWIKGNLSDFPCCVLCPDVYFVKKFLLSNVPFVLMCPLSWCVLCLIVFFSVPFPFFSFFLMRSFSCCDPCPALSLHYRVLCPAVSFEMLKPLFCSVFCLYVSFVLMCPLSCCFLCPAVSFVLLCPLSCCVLCPTVSFFLACPLSYCVLCPAVFLSRHVKRQFLYTNMVWAKNILPKKVGKLQQI